MNAGWAEMNKQLNIALVSNTAWNIHHFRAGLAHALKQAGHRIIAIAPPGSPADHQALRREHIDFIPLVHLSRKGLNPFSDLLLCLELKTQYKKLSIDLALHYTVKCNIYGSFAARFCGIPSISTVTGLGYAFMRPGPVQVIVSRLYRLAFRQPGVVLFQNADDKRFFESTRLVIPEKASLVPGSGIDPNKWIPRSTPAGHPENSGHFRFLFVGRLLHDKGIRELIAAADLLAGRGYQFVIDIVGAPDAGNPASLDQQKIRQSERPYLKFHGPKDNLKVWYAQAHAVVLPSYREGLPRVLLEAQSMEKPVIATRVAGCSELVSDGKTGLLVEPFSAVSLAEGMTKMMSMTAKNREEMGKTSRLQITERFSQEAVNQVYLQAIADLFDEEDEELR